MDPVQIVELFANPYTAVVAVLAAVVEEAPTAWLPAAVRRWIGWLCVLACAPVAVLLGQDMAPAMLGGFLGLGGSWLLVEAVRMRHRGTVARMTHNTDDRPPTPKPDHEDQPYPDDDPPPLLPPPPKK